jgi:predicted nucleic acid-binding Zn finger protein
MSEEKLDPALKSILRDKVISGKALEELAAKYEERFWRALKIVAEHRVKQYVFEPSRRTMWIVVGKEKDYLVLSDFYCSCKDFYLNAVIRQKNQLCYHLLAKIIGKSLNLYERFNVPDSQFPELMSEWRLIKLNT